MTEENGNAAKEVMVNLKTNIMMDDDEENIELITFGTLHHKPNAIYIRYIEHVENGEIHTTVKYSGEELLIIRNGAVKMRQYFILGKETEGSYQSVHGMMHMVIRTKKIEHTVSKDDKQEVFHINYGLIVQGEQVGIYSLTLTLTENNQMKQ